MVGFNVGKISPIPSLQQPNIQLHRLWGAGIFEVPAVERKQITRNHRTNPNGGLARIPGIRVSSFLPPRKKPSKAKLEDGATMEGQIDGYFGTGPIKIILGRHRQQFDWSIDQNNIVDTPHPKRIMSTSYLLGKISTFVELTECLLPSVYSEDPYLRCGSSQLPQAFARATACHGVGEVACSDTRAKL